MAKIFMSHSSKDKTFVERLANDLKKWGHEPWLDEWEINVGENIVHKIEKGISDCEYIVIVMTPDAIESKWVEEEWQPKYWDEINQKKIKVLPLLLQSCEIPELLKTKKYADFRNDYMVGLAKLIDSINNYLLENNQTPEMREKADHAFTELAIRAEEKREEEPYRLIVWHPDVHRAFDEQLYIFYWQLKGTTDGSK